MYTVQTSLKIKQAMTDPGSKIGGNQMDINISFILYFSSKEFKCNAMMDFGIWILKAPPTIEALNMNTKTVLLKSSHSIQEVVPNGMSSAFFGKLKQLD